MGVFFFITKVNCTIRDDPLNLPCFIERVGELVADKKEKKRKSHLHYKIQIFFTATCKKIYSFNICVAYNIMYITYHSYWFE